MSGSLLSLHNLRRTSCLVRRSLRLSSHFSTGDAFDPFNGLVSRRRNEARRSLLVQVAGVRSASDLFNVCSEFGSIKNMFHYKTKAKDMVLVEYEDSVSLKNAMESTLCPPLNGSIIPVHSPLVWLTASKATKTSQSNASSKKPGSPVPVVSEAQNNDLESIKGLHHCSDISEQVQMLYDYQKLTEIGWRLRFFTCRQIEIALAGLFPRASVLPFGSSVNTFGRHNCDLDMILELTDSDVQKDDHRLVFQAKKSRAAANPRITMQRHMEVISDLIDNFVPGCSPVRKILGARVPIIKYCQNYTGIECDLSMSNKSGFYMGEMLYIYGCMDPRVRPLVFTIRCWAKDRHMTSPFAGHWITNFSLTLMVLFYLMRTSPHVIPPLQTLIKLAGVTDRRETDGIDCTFLRDLRILTPSENKETLETLLKGFFEFYDGFDFKERGLSVVTGNDVVKPEHTALYIQNPLQRELNVSRNINFEELDRLSTEITNARYLLDGLSSPDARENEDEPWGVLRLCNSSTTHHVALKKGNIAIDWKDFFTPDLSDTMIVRADKPSSPVAKSTTNKKSESAFLNAVQRTGTNKEQIIQASDINGLVMKLKRKGGNKNSKKSNKIKGNRSG